MALSDPQVLAIFGSANAIILAAFGYIQNKFTSRVTREGTQDIRQTEVEKLATARELECNKRLDALHIKFDEMSTNNFTQLQLAIADRWAMEGSLRTAMNIQDMKHAEDIRKLQEDIEDLRDANVDLQSENMKLKLRMITIDQTGQQHGDLPDRYGDKSAPHSVDEDQSC